jgi:DNA-binding NarL/FixJ family response regulator
MVVKVRPEERNAVRIIVVDDHEVVREGLLATLGSQPGLTIVGVAATGRASIDLVRRTGPDVALVDLRLPDMSGNDVCREIVALAPGTRVVMLTTYLSEAVVRDALTAGAYAFVSKAAGVGKLVDVIRECGAPDASRASQHEVPLIVHELHELVAAREGGLRATPQQERVLELAANGLTNREVGERLFISESTVRFHIQKLKDVTAARTRTELIAKAIRAGLISPVA